MSQHTSLKSASRIATKRNVLKRFERVDLLRAQPGPNDRLELLLLDGRLRVESAAGTFAIELDPGSYVITEVSPDGYAQTAPVGGSTDTISDS